MQWLNKLSIRARLYMGTLFSLVMLLLVGGLGYVALETTHRQVQEVFSSKVQVLSDMEEVRNRLGELRLMEKNIIISANNTTQVQDLRGRWTMGMTALRARLEELQKSPTTPSDMSLNLESGVTYLNDYAKAMDELFGKVEDALLDSMAAAAYAESQRSTIEGMDSVLTTTAENARTDMEFTRRAVEDAAKQMSFWLGGLLLLAVAVLLPTTYFGVRNITRALADAQALAQRIAEGDLTQDVQVRQRDELGKLMLSMDRMQQSLRTLVQQVQESSSQVSVASGEIAGGNVNLSERTEQTASHLEQTARAMENLGLEVRHSAQASAHARDQANSAASVAAQGGQAVDSVVQTMAEITASARRIGDITGTIDAIAFQTNILALNAAVEAARAGEQGRGFAVVAGEVRVLAQRSAEAAKQIKQLTGESVRCADSGSAQVERAGQTMQAIVSSVERVATTIAEVSQACEVQDRQIGEVSTSVAELEQMTQQNAALVEESAAASAALREQALALDGAVRRFAMPGGTALQPPVHSLGAAMGVSTMPLPGVRPEPRSERQPPALAPVGMPVQLPRDRAAMGQIDRAERERAPAPTVRAGETVNV